MHTEIRVDTASTLSIHIRSVPPDIAHDALQDTPRDTLGDTRATIPCRFFQSGTCSKGANYVFSHNVPTATVNGRTEKIAGIQLEDGRAVDKEEEENWCGELGGAVVDFGHGATVTKVSFASDFSAVRLRDLPANSTPRSVVLLLATYMLSEQPGHDMVSEANVRVIPPSVDDPDHCQADVRVEDPHFATRLCAAVPTRATTENAFSAVVVNSNVALSSQTKAGTTSSLRRVDSKKVHVSWHKPTKSVWLNFGSETIAETVTERFQNGIYTVCGQ